MQGAYAFKSFKSLASERGVYNCEPESKDTKEKQAVNITP
jgi:hypothetical protein